MNYFIAINFKCSCKEFSFFFAFSRSLKLYYRFNLQDIWNSLNGCALCTNFAIVLTFVGKSFTYYAHMLQACFWAFFWAFFFSCATKSKQNLRMVWNDVFTNILVESWKSYIVGWHFKWNCNSSRYYFASKKMQLQLTR